MDEQRTEALSTHQHGLITRAQALSLGMTPSGIRHRVDSGRSRAVTRGLFRLAGSPKTPQQVALAAVLVAGDDAMVSHRSAAALHGLPGFTIQPVTISVRRHDRRSAPTTKIEESLAIPSHHRVIVEGIRCTTVARTLFDLCGDANAQRAERALDTALARKLVTMAQLWRVLIDLAEHGRAGTVLFRTILEERRGPYVAPESELEARFVALTRRHGLPEPERQVDLGDEAGWIGRVDFLFRGARLVVEVDGAEFHDGLVDRRHDEARDARFRSAGWQVLRFRWSDVVDHPKDVAQAIRSRCEFASP